MRGASKHKSPPNNPTLLQKLKELSAEAEDDKDIVSNLTPQEDSDKIEKNRYHITTNSTIIPVLIYQTGYTSPMMVYSLANFDRKKDRYYERILGAIGKREPENDVLWITLQARQSK